MRDSGAFQFLSGFLGIRKNEERGPPIGERHGEAFIQGYPVTNPKALTAIRAGADQLRSWPRAGI
jgi:hypothetical protein